jgi:hypothetical protein
LIGDRHASTPFGRVANLQAGTETGTRDYVMFASRGDRMIFRVEPRFGKGSRADERSSPWLT